MAGLYRGHSWNKSVWTQIREEESMMTSVTSVEEDGMIFVSSACRAPQTEFCASLQELREHVDTSVAGMHLLWKIQHHLPSFLHLLRHLHYG